MLDMVEPLVRVIGSYASPYVRKVLVCLEEKGIPYEIDPLVPFFGDERFAALSPLRRIPVLIDDRVTLCDSTVICEYLEERYPQPALFPSGQVDRAQARWLEEFADTRMGEVFIWHLFHQAVIAPAVFGDQTNRAVVHKALTEEIPQILDYLERQLPTQGPLFAGLPISIADITIAAFFRNASFARFQVDASRWPVTAAYVARTLSWPSFAKLARFENRLLKTPIAQHRAVLAELGAPLTAESYAVASPRRGIMGI
jgi:glutathione S-transferase